MCSTCARYARATFLNNALVTDAAASPAHFAVPSTMAFADDGAASGLSLPTVGLIGVTADDAGDGIGVAPGNPVLVVDDASRLGSIGTNGDQDYYRVELVAGQSYEIGLYGYTASPGDLSRVGVPVADSFLEVYDANGTFVVDADGGATTPANETNNGFDVLLSFTPKTSGVYYLNASAFDNGAGGEGVGDYEIFVKAVDGDDPSVYKPYYDTNEPLYALDWGSQVDGTVRNPDGAEGGRATGNPQLTADNKGFTTGYHGASTEGKNVVSIYFAKAGDVFISEDPTQPSLPPVNVAVGAADFEISAIWIALKEFEKVADVVFVETQDRASANFEYFTYKGTPGPGVSLLGSMSPPQELDEGLALFNSGDERWNPTNLAQGGFSFVTLIHEFGHGMGLAHPHDNGGRSGVMNGVTANGPVADYTSGDFALNQAVHTMMSYQDGWPQSPYGNAPTNVGYGYLGGPMAFDIAVLQDKYGVNEETARGDDVYALKDVNAAGTFYSSIWDGGGNDTIAYDGARDSTIDLRPATLQYEVGGGGNVSFAFGIFGGYTIANGVTIENARTGTGNDTLIGNVANNMLDGGAGDDLFNLSAGGDDSAIGGAGDDGFFLGGALTAADRVDGGAGSDDQVALQGRYAGLVFGAANLAGIETLVLLPGSDARFGGASEALAGYNLTTVNENVAAGTELIVNMNTLRVGEDVTFNGSAETDGSFLFFGGSGADRLTGGQASDAFFFGTGKFGGGDRVDGRGGNDQLGLQGDFSGGNALTLGADQIAGVETIVLLTATDNRFGGGAPMNFSYALTASDGNVAAGATLTINANTLGAGETLTFDGSAESDGSYRVFGGAGADAVMGGQGADQLFGGAGNDTIRGGLGADALTGGAGDDLFRYDGVIESTAAARDTINGFASGDRIDLSGIDARSGTAENDGFAFIGDRAFSNTAGELRAVQSNGSWFVEADVNGDGRADLVIQVNTDQGATLGVNDFVI